MNLLPFAACNADFQCSAVYTTALLGRDPVTVHHGCKDGLPADYWMVVFLQSRGDGPRWVYLDVRDVAGDPAWNSAGATKTRLRALFAAALQARFKSADELWTWATGSGQICLEPGRAA